MYGQACLDGGLGPGGVDLEVAIAAVIADDRDAQGGIAGGDFRKAFFVHCCLTQMPEVAKFFLRVSSRLIFQFFQKTMKEGGVVALGVMHGTAHAGVAFAEAQVVGRVVLGGLALGPVPAATVLDVDYINGVASDDGPAVLQAKVVDAREAFFKHLRAHDSAADAEEDAVVQRLHRATE